MVFIHNQILLTWARFSLKGKDIYSRVRKHTDDIPPQPDPGGVKHSVSPLWGLDSR